MKQAKQQRNHSDYLTGQTACNMSGQDLSTQSELVAKKLNCEGQKWLTAIQLSKQGNRGRDAPWRHKLDPSVWDQVQISLKSLLRSQPSPQTHLLLSLSPPIPPRHAHTYPGTVGNPYPNIFTHHITAQHMVLCTSVIGGTWSTHTHAHTDTRTQGQNL